MARVLNVITAISPMGGTITKLRALMKNSKHQHYLYHPGYDSNRSIIEEEISYYSKIGVKAYYGVYNRNVIKHVRDINKIIKRHHIDIVHFYFNFENLFVPLIRLCNPKIKVVRSIVGFDEELSVLRKLLLSVSFSFTSNFVLISNYIKNLYEDTYPVLKKKNSRIIYNGAVNTKDVQTPLEDRKMLVTTSGLCERKNVLVLIEAMNIIKNQYKRNDIQLYVLGDGPERIKIEKLIDKYKLNSNIILVGYTNEVANYLDKCAIYVHPATTEGFGIAVTEAMQMYCPCIVSDKGALPELVENGENGYVVDAYDANSWANKILYLKDNEILRIKQSKASFKRATEKFSLKSFIDNHDLLYDQLYKG